MDLDGYSHEALRPPYPLTKAGDEAAFPSFLYFERDRHGPCAEGFLVPLCPAKKVGHSQTPIAVD
jgi:hypothetical protein